MTLVEKIKTIYPELTSQDFIDNVQVQNDYNNLYKGYIQ
jgi:hypothetical protein